jgi:hypothetical protein
MDLAVANHYVVRFVDAFASQGLQTLPAEHRQGSPEGRPSLSLGRNGHNRCACQRGEGITHFIRVRGVEVIHAERDDVSGRHAPQQTRALVLGNLVLDVNGSIAMDVVCDWACIVFPRNAL